MATSHHQKFIQHYQRQKLGEKAAEKLTALVGSWLFILMIFATIFCWIFINLYIPSLRWDSHPYILLNFVLSCIAAISAPIILMSQNREAKRDRRRAEYDYLVNKKAEKEIRLVRGDLMHIHHKIDKIHKHIKKR